MADSKPVARLKVLRRQANPPSLVLVRCKSHDRVSIGSVSIPIKNADCPHKVPKSYLPSDISSSVLQHLKWMMQKDLLGQDIFLIGGPGPTRRRLALMYLEMTNKEHEYIALSRDTTESDMKQRREIKSGTAYYIDQCAVRAALNGRVLILEGIEKAERNVLPVLNNLLENREMQLEDGRFLMRSKTYDKLLQSHSQQELDNWKIVRVSEDFRVIALGLPIPRYQGNPLDPPLRSRFQARDIINIPFKEQYDVLRQVYPALDSSALSELLSFSHTLLQEEASSLNIADFPLSNIPLLAALMNQFPLMTGQDAVQRLYPYKLFLAEEGRKAVADTINNFQLGLESLSKTTITSVARDQDSTSQASIKLSDGVQYKVPCGNKELSTLDEHYVPTEYHDRLLSDIIQSHAYHDICVIGPRGCGKSTLVRKLSSLLGYHTEPILLYQDMTSRDLLQQRTTLSNGDTAWRPSALIDAVTKGHIAVLDGLHRINGGTFSVLASLIQDRELHLADGSRLLRNDRFDELAQELGKTETELNELGVLRIHPSFRIIALAEPPNLTTPAGQWLNAEMLSLFLFHSMEPLPIKDEVKVIDSLTHDDISEKLFELSEHLRRSKDPTCQALANSLSTRNLLRIAKRLSKFPQESLHDVIHSACMSRFLPKLARQTLDQTLENLAIFPSTPTKDIEILTSCSVNGNELRIGNTVCQIQQSSNLMKVPDTLFYDNALHIATMESMLKDYMSGEHLLLVGNQGVGKNKVVDRFLQLLGRPREYIQLHRDTTVQTLTLQPTVRDGRIVYDDSPLVKAVREGLVLVIDEADKAPTNVTCILKTLVESGQMHLSDGRKIVTDVTDMDRDALDKTIQMHPEFRMIVLANRPGFPFLGNDFFAAVGDIFSCHALDNPDIDSEISMLRQYGADVPEATLHKLVLAFGELRTMADQGLIAYPYSTREVVNIVKHLQLFPDDGLATVVSNVFDFDQYNKEMKDTVIDTMHKHGIPVGASPNNVTLAKEYLLPPMKLSHRWTVSSSASSLPVESRPVSVKGPVQALVTQHVIERKSARSTRFTELDSSWILPLAQENSHICDIATSLGEHRNVDMTTDLMHFACVNPVGLYTMKKNDQTVAFIDLYDAFPTTNLRYQPSVRICTMGASVYDTVLLHEQVSNILLAINPETGKVRRLEMGGILDQAADMLSRRLLSSNRKPTHRMCSDLAHTADGIVALYEINRPEVLVMNIFEGTCHAIQFPFPVTSIKMPSINQWMVEDNSNKMYIIERHDETSYTCKPVETEAMTSVSAVSSQPLDDTNIIAITGERVSAPNRLLATNNTHAMLAIGLPDLQDVDIYCCPREEPIQASPERANVVVQPISGQIIRSLSGHQPPKTLAEDGMARERNVSGYLELSDLTRNKLRYLKVYGSGPSPYSAWFKSPAGPMIAPLSGDGLVSVDSGGRVQIWETSQALLESSLKGWTKLIGQSDNDLQMTYERDGVKDCTVPKHGKVDPTGAPHVGGNTWAGGTGGRDTAGLGGVGGPYRLDAGHDVHQVPQSVKDQVPEHIRKAAREMGEKAFKERLKQIQMSEYDAEVYERFYSSVKRHVQSLRVVLDSLQAKGKERQWLRNQTYGDLDDGRIIEGLTGEKTIYRRRGEKEPEPGSPQEKPKRIRLLVDVSGSMYRFNGYDARLEREMEAMCMVMEAFQGYEHKLKYDIYGHSGEDYNVQLTSATKPPADNKQRLQVLQTMHAHSQFCLSGDFTLRATRHAIEEISKEEADEHFVIVLSDANLERYGIRAASFADALTCKENVNAYAIFIGSLGDQADRLVKQLPSGHSFACLDTAKIPQILQQIFTSTFLRS